MRAFITGGSGFVGRRLIGLLAIRGWELRALARSDAAAEVVSSLGAAPVRGDLDSVEAMSAGMRGCQMVFHAAASTKEWASDAEMWAANVTGTENVIAAARAAGVKRLVHVGTEAALVDGRPLVNVDESYPIPPRPLRGYPRTKAEAERRVLAANGGGLETVVVRPRFVWGRDDTNLLPKLADAVQKGRWAWVDGGAALTSTCHVANCCEALRLAAERGKPGEVYFVTDGAPLPLREFVTAVGSAAGLKLPDRTVSFGLALLGARLIERLWRILRLSSTPPAHRLPIYLFGRQMTVRDDKARRELGYREVMTRERGLEEMRRA